MLRRRALLLATPGAAGLVLSGLARAQAETGDPAGDRARLDALEPKVLAQLERFRTPGVSVAVVRSGHVLLVRGYGQRHIAHGLPMTSDTVQPIGSVTKSFTAAVIASLVREGRMRWDQPVRELLPAFRLANEELTQRVTVRDLLTHRTGVARHDTAWFGSPFTREQWMERLRHLEPSAGLRERFQYNNFMVMAAGYVAGVIAGSSWEALVQQRLFVPLGMRRSSTTLAGLAAEADRGSGHTEGDDGRPVLQAYQALDAMGPTGSINSSAADMARYLLMLADGGRFEGRPIVEPGDLAEMTGVQMVANSRSRWRELAPSQYGLGFFVGSYRGERSFEHGGSLPGLASRLIVLPERRLGIFVAANLRRSAVSTTLPYLLIDHLLGLPEVDWSARLEAEAAAQRAAARSADAAGTATRVAGTVPPRAIGAYAGVFEHPGYGRVVVQSRADAARPLGFEYNGMRSSAAHHHHEVFRVPPSSTDLLDETVLHFVPDAEGDIRELRLRLEPALPPIVFRRLPDGELLLRERLLRFVGDYAGPAGLLSVALGADGVLTLVQGGGTAQTLQPIAGARFAVQGREDLQLLFRLPTAADAAQADGKADAVVMLMPRRNLLAPRRP